MADLSDCEAPEGHPGPGLHEEHPLPQPSGADWVRLLEQELRGPSPSYQCDPFLYENIVYAQSYLRRFAGLVVIFVSNTNNT